MVEKLIDLKDIALVDFLGVENQNIETVAAAFPEAKLVSRGNELKIKGDPKDVLKLNDVINSLLEHYHKFGRVTLDEVVSLLEREPEMLDANQVNQDVILFGVKGSGIKAKTHNQQQLVEAVLKNDLVFAIGPAGTGKTYISAALAVRALKNKQIKKIIITRPAVEAGETLGFLPGDLKEKIDPYLKPIHDALGDMILPEKLRFYEEKGIIEIAPLAYMRGRTLNNAFILLDEAQNTTFMQIKMFLTRMGPNSKVIVTGDQSQVDLPKNQCSGLAAAVSILKGVKGVSFVYLDSKDVVRHKLVKNIIKAYEEHDLQSNTGK